ncbi:MAG: TRAP transporter small permease subunit [Granulosicoccus sp.]
MFRRFSALLDYVTNGLNIIGSVLIVSMMILINVDVIGRNIFNKPVPGVPELVTMSIVIVVFLQVAYAFRCGHLTRTPALLKFVERRSLRARAVLEFFLSVVAGTVVLQLILASWPLFLKAWVGNTYEGTIGNFTIPIWPVKMIIVVGSVALFSQILFRALQALYAFKYRLPLDRVPDGKS